MYSNECFSFIKARIWDCLEDKFTVVEEDGTSFNLLVNPNNVWQVTYSLLEDFNVVEKLLELLWWIGLEFVEST